MLNPPASAPFKGSEDEGADGAGHCGTAAAGFLGCQVPQSTQLCFPLLEALSIAKVLWARGADRHFPSAVMVPFQQPMFQDELESI